MGEEWQPTDAEIGTGEIVQKGSVSFILFKKLELKLFVILY